MKKAILFFVTGILLAFANIQAQSKLQTKVSSVNILCGGDSTGKAAVYPNGGESPYTYLWVPGGNTTASDTALAAGTYTVIITDIAHDTLITTITITQPVLLNLSVASYTNVS